MSSSVRNSLCTTARISRRGKKKNTSSTGYESSSLGIFGDNVSCTKEWGLLARNPGEEHNNPVASTKTGADQSKSRSFQRSNEHKTLQRTHTHVYSPIFLFTCSFAGEPSEVSSGSRETCGNIQTEDTCLSLPRWWSVMTNTWSETTTARFLGGRTTFQIN